MPLFMRLKPILYPLVESHTYTCANIASKFPAKTRTWKAADDVCGQLQPRHQLKQPVTHTTKLSHRVLPVVRWQGAGVAVQKSTVQKNAVQCQDV